MTHILHIGIEGLSHPHALAFRERAAAKTRRDGAWLAAMGEVLTLVDDFGTEMTFARGDLRATVVMEVREERAGLARPGGAQWSGA